jgi:hypothetical protein
LQTASREPHSRQLPKSIKRRFMMLCSRD